MQTYIINYLLYKAVRDILDYKTILKFTTVGSNGGVVTPSSQDQKFFFFVQSVILDEILAYETKIDLIKIDIEAHEPFAIRGMDKLIRKFKPIIVTEFHAWAMSINNVSTPQEYLEQLIQYNYRLSIIDTSGHLIDAPDTDFVMNFWKDLKQETIHLDLIARP